jgi:hypothetical protein
MTTRDLMSAAAVMMLLAGVPAIAHANDEAAPVAAEETAVPADEAAAADAGTADEGAADEATEEAPAE